MHPHLKASLQGKWQSQLLRLFEEPRKVEVALTSGGRISRGLGHMEEKVLLSDLLAEIDNGVWRRTLLLAIVLGLPNVSYKH